MYAAGAPLLLTKLDIPPLCAHTLQRERLLALVTQAPRARLVLASAPAGFGKTTFLSTWSRDLAARRGAAIAWLTLDTSDNDPVRFLGYLLAAVARAAPHPEDLDGISDRIGAPGQQEIVLTRLINALATLERELVLVLDDYHLISAPPIHAAVAFLLEHLPEQARLAIGTRADPPLPLARLRAREQLVELRAAELRFTQAEVAAFLQATGCPAITPDEARAIGAYVEGWPAGVQLVARALHMEAREQSGGDATNERKIDDMLARLTTSQRHVFAYLADDVFERQPHHLKTFLLQTAILDRMCGPLCDAILGLGAADLGLGEERTNPKPPAPSPEDSYSRLILEQLERANLFVVPLDGEQRWYRYHHLFRAFLCARLEREPRIAVDDLHRRARRWYASHNLLPGALAHALAAEEVDVAIDLIDRAIERGENDVVCRWLKSRTGEAARQRLRQAAAASGHAERLAEVLAPDGPARNAAMPIGLSSSNGVSASLVEPLSEREVEVLRLIAGGSSNQHIADTLIISIGTVKSHINHILGKLGARSRTEAVARAREFGLLAP